MADRKIRKHIAVAAAFLLALIGIQILYLAKLSVWDGDALAAHPLNTRSALMEQDIRRGRILDREGRVLAESSADHVRSYPYGRILAPVTGYQTERYGSVGVEQAAGQALSGVTADAAHAGPLRTLLRADAGYDVRLTVDAELSEAAWNALGTRRGAVIVMDAATGAVRAMVSSPSFDPAAVEKHWDELTAREDSPLLNRAAQGLYPPGSTFKTLIADAALEAGVTNPDEVFTCTGELAIGSDYVLHESHGEVHGKLHLADALRESCNVTFATLALRLGASGLSSAFERFGIGTELADPELPMAAAHVPEMKRLGDGEIAQTGIGQGALLVTPLQMALVADAFANGGKMMQPYLIAQVLTAQGTPLYEASPTVWRTATTAQRAAVIDGYMADVVAAGTGTAADVAGVRVTGKTGTAENASGTDHAWFIGSAERGGHKIVMAVIVEEGGFGGRAAAGIAHRIIQTYFAG
ncbi:MAG: peptidoglycan D,D-transpeptidase FtsI family protein [Selenomonas massiliensis]